MGIGVGLSAGLKALTAAQLALQTAGHNIANANTPGFTRQRVLLSAAMPFTVGRGFQIGTGVNVSNIARIVDEGLERRVNLQISLFGRASMNFGRLRELESILAEPDNGLSSSISTMFGNLASLQTDPSDRALRGGAIQSARALADSFNLLSRRYNDISTNTVAEIQGLTRLVNEKTAAIANLNTQIISSESNGSTANDLRDRRGQLITEVSELIDTRTLERSTGAVDLLIAGRLLVSGSRSNSISARKAANGLSEILVEGRSKVTVTSGKIGALLQQEGTKIPGMLADFDSLARNLILGFNRIHSTGIAGSGPFQSLTSAIGSVDTDKDGSRGDELLSSAGLPFDIVAGELYVSVTNRVSNDLERTRIDIDPQSMTLNQLAASLSAIDHLSASVDPAGRLRVSADSGFGFDFASRLDSVPDTFGSFGGAFPSLSNSGGSTFDLSTGPATKEFTVDVNGTVETVTLDTSDFANSSQATVDELVTAINADLTNATAANIGGRLVIRANASGSATTLTISDTVGTPLTTLGMATGPANGQDAGVTVSVSGSYTGTSNGQLRFVPDSDGVIGTTPNLTVSVFDANGLKVASIDVGAGYDPETSGPIEVLDGVKVAFSRGTISATDNQSFALDILADSDTSDVLVAIGMNSFFLGDSAENIEVSADLINNSSLLAAGMTNASGNGDNLAKMVEFRNIALTDLNSSTIEGFYNGLVGDLGFDVATAETTLRGQTALLDRIQAERQSVSGVNLDEEMIDIIRFQQAFEAASRFINIVQELTTTLINLGR